MKSYKKIKINPQFGKRSLHNYMVQKCPWRGRYLVKKGQNHDQVVIEGPLKGMNRNSMEKQIPITQSFK